MKASIIVAVASSIIINTVSICKHSKDRDIFSKADKKFSKTQEKKCNANASNCKAKHWHTCKGVV